MADPSEPTSFDGLNEQLLKLEAARNTGGNRLFYLATPPGAFAPIARELGRIGLLQEDGGAWRRLVVEKPFGTDLESAKALNTELLKIVDEHQIYRIDHYLGKETVQNILVMRFTNGMFEPIWNRHYIDHIQITVDEKLGVGHRGSFYDSTGALRDMVPNHLFQLLSLVAMEPPARFDRQARQHHGDLRRAEADHRQLALGWRSLLSAHRQGAWPQAHGGRDQVPSGAVRDVCLHSCRAAGGELPRDRH